MPNNKSSSNKRLIKDGQIIDNDWQIITDPEAPLATDKLLVSLDIWQNQQAALASRTVGLWLQNDQDISAIAPNLTQFPVIAIDFPGFMDGRGFSLARLLRERYGYQGEIRATGAVIRDQLYYLKRCGFNAFDLDESIDLEAALTSLNDFSESYQTSADQKLPLFRRRA